MEWDENEPRNAKKPPKPLEPLSIEELESYIAALSGEIERAHAEIAKKKAVRNAAAAFFKT